jgi:hypothetical protein
MDYKKFIVPVVAVAAAVFVFIFPVKAADTTSISISPLTFDLSGNAGDTIVNEVIVRNTGKETLNINVESQDFVASGEEGEVNLTDTNNTYSLSKWIEINDGKFAIAGGQQKRVKFSIRLPFNAEPGGHYASVFAHLSPPAGAQSGAYIGQKIGALVLMRVAGKTTESASVETFKTAKSQYAKGPVDFDLRIKNTGTVHIKPKGMIAITNMWGKKVADVSVDQKNVLPGAIRHMSAKWEKTPKFGKYTATLLTYYGPDNKQLTAATTFWIIPWKTVAIWGGILLIVLVLLYIGRRRVKEATKALMGKR